MCNNGHLMSFVKKNKGTYTGQSQTKVSQQEAELKAIIIYKHNTSDLLWSSKAKRIVDNNVSTYAFILLANKIISYNATILNITYERLIASDTPKSVIDNFIRISPVAWGHLSFTGRYNFTTDNSIMDLEKIVRFLEEKLGKTPT